MELNIEKQLIIVESYRDILNKVFLIDLNDKLPKFEYGGIVRAPLTKKQKAGFPIIQEKGGQLWEKVCRAFQEEL